MTAENVSAWEKSVEWKVLRRDCISARGSMRIENVTIECRAVVSRGLCHLRGEGGQSDVREEDGLGKVVELITVI